MAKRCFSYSVGEWGCRVRVYERKPGGMLWIAAWDPTLRGGKGGYRRQSLGHRKRRRAKTYALEVSERLRRDEAGLEGGPLRLCDLFALFREERLPQMHGKHRQETERQLGMWARVLGDSYDVRGFSRRDWDHFARVRSAGIIDGRGWEVPDPERRRPVSPRVCAKDLAFLRSVFKWATEWRHPGSHRFLLDANPSRGLAPPKEKNPNRPVVTFDRYKKLLEVAPQVKVRVGRGRGTVYVRAPLRELLILAEGTGRRVGAIVALRWSDWFPDRGTYRAIRWRADSDKLGREWVAPVSPEVRRALETWRRECPGVGEAPDVSPGQSS